MSEEKFVVKFDYNKEALIEIAEEAKNIDLTDIDAVKEATKILVGVRGKIQKQGKSHRDEANAFNKNVLTIEKEYVGIIEPLELEYKELIETDKQVKIIEARKELLQMKKDQLDLLPAIESPSDEFILSLDDAAWVEYYNEKMAENKSSIEKQKQDKIDAENAEEEIKQITEQARLNGIAQAERAAKDAKAKAEAEAEQKAIKEKADEDARVQKETDHKSKLEADKKFQDWKKDIENSNIGVTLEFRLVGGVTEVWEFRTDYKHN
ncbi:MAG: hypothetical protein ACTSQE_14895 [Candidatus Heimdallarchaeaceae archaeon]